MKFSKTLSQGTFPRHLVKAHRIPKCPEGHFEGHLVGHCRDPLCNTPTRAGGPGPKARAWGPEPKARGNSAAEGPGRAIQALSSERMGLIVISEDDGGQVEM